MHPKQKNGQRIKTNSAVTIKEQKRKRESIFRWLRSRSSQYLHDNIIQEALSNVNVHFVFIIVKLFLFSEKDFPNGSEGAGPNILGFLFRSYRFI